MDCFRVQIRPATTLGPNPDCDTLYTMYAFVPSDTLSVGPGPILLLTLDLAPLLH